MENAVKQAKAKKEKEVLYYPVPATVFTYAGRYIPSSLPVAPASTLDNPYISSSTSTVHGRSRLKAFFQKSKSKWNNMSLKMAFSFYVVFFILIALALSLVVFALLSNVFRIIQDKQFVDILSLLSFILIVSLFITAIMIAGMRFYQNRLEPAIKLLDDASMRISSKDLDFSVSYFRKDEMGRLCESFERMRETLETTYVELFRQFEERKRLNSVFSHDLRTPITVLKGNIQLLSEYLEHSGINDETIESSIFAMENHVTRLENYVNMMNRLQKLEDISVNRVTTGKNELCRAIYNTASILCRDLELKFLDDINTEELFVDAEIITVVAENLISNAARFAKNSVSISCAVRGDFFVLSISDDGKGFSREDLLNATAPFYKASKNVFDSHFGLGLNISKTLSRQHGGTLTLANTKTGALVTAEFSQSPV